MTDNKYADFFKINKETWDKKVAIHSRSDFYKMEDFLKGKSSLNKLELDELGNVKGKSLLHLQCHFGQDTLSFSRMGATATGIDLSSEAIKEAKELNKKLGLNASFVESNVYDVPKNIDGKFDIVFTSYGVVGWLPDLDIWADVIFEKLNTGGVFYMAEFHPIVWMFDYLQEPATMKYSYSQSEVIYEEYKGTYANNDADMISKEYGWNHGLGEVVSALSRVGLHVEFLNEYYESPYDCLPNMEKTDKGMFVFKENKLFPLIYSIKATKK